MKKWSAVLLAALLVSTMLLTGCGTKGVKNGDTVKVEYTLLLEDGSIFDTSVGGDPFEFTIGEGQVIDGFENAVKGMKFGESKTVTIPPSEAYGEYDEDLVQVVDRTDLPEGLDPKVGDQLLATREDGSTGVVTVIEVSYTTITVDSNPALAGKTLTFEIKLLEIVGK
ncbi:MAG: peptidylprolyl isomerase [Dehalococcoidales bacterium]|nr:peptidylprolyl isomerase [Dehalococcoidales bacterium]